jgi:hypothetical protein
VPEGGIALRIVDGGNRQKNSSGESGGRGGKIFSEENGGERGVLVWRIPISPVFGSISGPPGEFRGLKGRTSTEGMGEGKSKFIAI